jgi:hypothetical protein
MSSDAAMDISNSIFQDQVADSLMDPEGTTPLPEGWGHIEVREPESQPSEGSEDHFASDELDRASNLEGPWQDDQREGEGDAGQREPQPVAQQEPQQAVEVTPQEIAARIEQTDAFIAERQLVDPTESAAMASELGIDPAQAPAAGQSLARLGIAAIAVLDQAQWDLANVRPMHGMQLQAVHDEVCKLAGIEDPRLSPVANRQAFGADIMFGIANFFATVSRYGMNASLAQLNDAQQAEAFVNRLRSHFGENQPIDRATALRTVDAFTRPLLSLVRKLDAQRQAASPPRRASASRSAASSRQRTTVEGKPSSVPRMRTNNDLFDAQTLAAYQLDHGRL